MHHHDTLHRIAIACLLTLAVIPHGADAQPDLVSRVATYDGGGLQSWSAESVYPGISLTSNFSNPQTNMARHGGTYYHAFTATVGDADVYLRTSTDGLSWTAPVQVNDDVPATSPQSKPNLVVYANGGSTVVVVSWEDRRATPTQLRSATSMDGGLSFAASVPVSNHTDAVSITGNLAVDGGGRLYAAWSRYDGGCYGYVWFSFSGDDGATWSTMTPLYSGQCYTAPAHVVAGGADSVMVLISEDQFNHKNVITLYSTDGGVGFGFASVTSYSITQSITEYMTSTVDGSGRVHLVFTYGETLGTASSIRHTSSANWGQTWTPSVAVSDAPLFPVWSYHGGQVPAVAVAPSTGDIYVAWADPHAATNNFEVYLTRSTDGGLTWDADQMVNLLQTPFNQYYASMALQDLGGGNAYVVVTWNDDRNAVGIPEQGSFADIQLHPVPAVDQLTIDLPSATFGPIRYEVRDVRGSLIRTGTWTTGGPQVIDVSLFAPGMHMLRLVRADQTVAIPWVKE